MLSRDIFTRYDVDTAERFSTLSDELTSDEKENIMARFQQDIPKRVTVYHDDIDQEKALKNAMLPEKPRYFNGSPTYEANSIDEFKDKLSHIGMSLDN